MPQLFVNGGGMSGGELHHNIADHPFIAAVRTAPHYRFYSVRDEFPGIVLAEPGQGAAVVGELYDVPLATLREKFIPDEPAELELSVIELDDGSSVLSMVLRPGEAESGKHRDITEFGGWRAYRGLPG